MLSFESSQDTVCQAIGLENQLDTKSASAVCESRLIKGGIDLALEVPLAIGDRDDGQVNGHPRARAPHAQQGSRSLDQGDVPGSGRTGDEGSGRTDTSIQDAVVMASIHGRPVDGSGYSSHASLHQDLLWGGAGGDMCQGDETGSAVADTDAANLETRAIQYGVRQPYAANRMSLEHLLLAAESNSTSSPWQRTTHSDSADTPWTAAAESIAILSNELVGDSSTRPVSGTSNFHPLGICLENGTPLDASVIPSDSSVLSSYIDRDRLEQGRLSFGARATSSDVLSLTTGPDPGRGIPAGCSTLSSTEVLGSSSAVLSSLGGDSRLVSDFEAQRTTNGHSMDGVDFPDFEGAWGMYMNDNDWLPVIPMQV